MGTIVILTPGFPVNEQDTTCLPSVQQFVAACKRNFPTQKIIILAFQYPFEKKDYLWHGIPVFAIGGSNHPGIRRLITWLKAYRRLRVLKKQHQLDGLLSLWLTECSLVGKYFARFNGLKHFMWMLGQDAKKSNQYIKRIKPRGREIIAHSDFLQHEYFKNHGQKPFLVAENGVTEKSFPPLNKGPRPYDVLGVGSLIPLKNYALFIDIIADLKETFPHIKALIAGSGIEEQNLKNKVAHLGLSDQVIFKGMISHSDVFDLMNQSRIFLHTSTYEGNSTVLVEALYSGCFTVSTQPLSDGSTKNLTVLETKAQFVKEIQKQLSKQEGAYERVTFNTMDNTAKKIMELYL